MINWQNFFRAPAHPLIQTFESFPVPTKATPVEACSLLVIDLELTGLDPKRDHIVSMGWVPVRAAGLRLADARHYLIKSPISVGQSATIHGLHDRDLANAHALEDVLAELLRSYAGYIFVAHNAAMDKAFLQAALKRCYGRAPRWQFLDTLAIERNRLNRRQLPIQAGSLRLNACLHRYKLPLVSSHNALEDAYSCALLLLAQISQTRSPKPMLGDLLKEGAV